MPLVRCTCERSAVDLTVVVVDPHCPAFVTHVLTD